LRGLQKLLLFCLSSRLRTIRDILYENYQFFPSSITSYDKLFLVFSLKFLFILNSTNYFVIFKKNSMSFFFEVPDFYNRCSQMLFSIVLFPLIESNSNRNYLFFRPYRDSYDIFLALKNVFLRNLSFLWFCNLKLFTFVNNFSWLLKNFPFCKTVVNKWVYFIFLKKNYFSENFFLKNNSIYLVVVNFLFNGFVSNR
jgi:hypothetical protein